ncbi:Flp/Fap pilin component [Sphingomonas sp. EC-HK361]|uniref:Flp family type IVb pilin n=1 Tax=Sphingomonas sp. EC-HK361 TaxID=2038397 RepID=UPI001252BEF6|nr:Flp family type IVb pilin [Sphingomonas sp. EC-HK361]VVT10397.1 Flp/Fap pilin component [Sphingomonas sp. EC-HK361]
MNLRRRLSPRALARQLSRLAADERGATAVEYGLILALIFLAVVGSIQAVANSTTGMWNDVSSKVANAR